MGTEMNLRTLKGYGATLDFDDTVKNSRIPVSLNGKNIGWCTRFNMNKYKENYA